MQAMMEPGFAQGYEDLYRRHWWFRVRERILVEVLQQLNLPQGAAILDVGCGNGLFFDRLAQFGTVQGIEIDRSLVPADSVHRMRISHWPLGSPHYDQMRFQLITALDVIEHIEDDRQAVEHMWALLVPGGKLVITVPALMTLWDAHDEINGHYRRYTRSSLRALLQKRGRLISLRYLFHALVVPKCAIAAFNRVFQAKAAQHGVPAAWLNGLMETASWLEYRMVGGWNLPFGTSLLAVVEKPR